MNNNGLMIYCRDGMPIDGPVICILICQEIIMMPLRYVDQGEQLLLELKTGKESLTCTVKHQFDALQ